MKLTDNSPINFIEDIWHYLSPFSAHQIIVEDETYPTLEHAYHALRIQPGPEREEIRTAKSPMDAWRLGQKYKETLLIKDFDKDALMEKLMRLKLAQHSDIRDILVLSGNRGLLKIYPTDHYWGTGDDGSGENKMGKLWMKLRDELHEVL